MRILIFLIAASAFAQFSPPSGGGSGNVTASGTLTSTGCVTGAGTTVVQVPSANCTIDASGNIIANTITTGGPTPTMNGVDYLKGSTSGGVAFSVANVAGTAITYIYPTSNGAAGQALTDNGSTTCPTNLLANAPATCHQLIWTTPSSSFSLFQSWFQQSGTTIPGSTTRYFPLMGSTIYVTGNAENLYQMKVQAAGSLKNFCVQRYNDLQPNDGSLVYTVRQNGADSAVTVTFAANTTGVLATPVCDTTHTLTISSGDLLDISAKNNSASTSGTILGIFGEISIN